MTVSTDELPGNEFQAGDLSVFPMELRLILSCLHVSHDECDSALIRTLVKEQIDWDHFLLSVDRHRVAPLVYTNLRRLAWDVVPARVRGSLHDRYESNVLRNVAMAAETTRLTRRLETNGIPVLALKGAALALLVYGNLALRSAGDIDLLIAERDVDRADLVIREGGYCRETLGFSQPYLSSVVKKLAKDFQYFKASQRIYLDLHWRLNNTHSIFGFDFDSFRDQAQTVRVGGQPVRTLSDIHLLPYLLMHGAAHEWQRLFWLCDLAEILRISRGLDWSHLMAAATELGILRHLTQGLILSHVLLGSQLPDLVRAYAERDRVVSQLVTHGVNSILEAPIDPQSWSGRLQLLQYILSLSRSFRYKIEVISRSPYWIGYLSAIRNRLTASTKP